MANGRNPRKKGATGRDCGGFAALPWMVLDSPAYTHLSHPARGLLIEFARQYVRDNNGRLLASSAYLLTRGWKSRDVITRAKNELIEAGFIYETVKGHRPNKASWYAITWYALDKIKGYDPGAEKGFVRSAYLTSVQNKIKALVPAGGTGRYVIVPRGGLVNGSTGPPDGLICDSSFQFLSPLHGNHLDKPSVRNE